MRLPIWVPPFVCFVFWTEVGLFYAVLTTTLMTVGMEFALRAWEDVFHLYYDSLAKARGEGCRITNVADEPTP